MRHKRSQTYRNSRVVPKTEIAMLILKGMLAKDIAEYAQCSIGRVNEIKADLMTRRQSA